MQNKEDQGYGFEWMNKKRGLALKQMEENKENMWGVRSFGVRLMEAEIEERVN